MSPHQPTVHADAAASPPPSQQVICHKQKTSNCCHDIPTKPVQGESKILFHIVEFTCFLFANMSLIVCKHNIDHLLEQRLLFLGASPAVARIPFFQQSKRSKPQAL
jgi:hypothetical protein